MSQNQANFLDIKILDRDLRVSCPPEERESLMEAANYLNHRMQKIQEAGKIASTERIAIMAALNISHELLSMRTGAGFDLAEFKRRMLAMQTTIEQTLAEQDELF